MCRETERVSLRLRLFTLAVLSLSAVGCQSRAPSQGEAEIRQLLDHWAKAFGAHDVNAAMSIYAPDVVAYDIVPPLQAVGKDAYRKNYEQFVAQYDGPIEVEFRDLHIAASDDVAIAEGLEQISGTIKGQKTSIWARFTSGFRKINGAWLDVHDHVSVPTDFATGKSLLDLKP